MLFVDPKFCFVRFSISGGLFNSSTKRTLVFKTVVNIIANKVSQKRLQAQLLLAKTIWKDQKANPDHLSPYFKDSDYTGYIFK